MSNYFGVEGLSIYFPYENGNECIPSISINGCQALQYEVRTSNSLGENQENLERVLALQPTLQCPAKQVEGLDKVKALAQEKFDRFHPDEPGQGFRGWQKHGPFWMRKRDYRSEKENVGYCTHRGGAYVCGRVFQIGVSTFIENSTTERWSILKEVLEYPTALYPMSVKDWNLDGFRLTEESILVKHHGDMPPLRLFKFVK